MLRGVRGGTRGSVRRSARGCVVVPADTPNTTWLAAKVVTIAWDGSDEGWSEGCWVGIPVG